MADTDYLNQLAEKIKDLRSKESEKAQEKKAITDELESAEGQMLELLTEAGLTSYSSPFGRVGISYRTSVRTPKTQEDKEAFFSYLKEIGQYDLLISINSQSLNSFYKEQLSLAKEQGLDDFIVPGINEVKITPTLSFTQK